MSFFASIVAVEIVTVSQQLDLSELMLEPNLLCFVIGFMNFVLRCQLVHLINLEMLDSSYIILTPMPTMLLLAQHLIQQLD